MSLVHPGVWKVTSLLDLPSFCSVPGQTGKRSGAAAAAATVGYLSC